MLLRQHGFHAQDLEEAYSGWQEELRETWQVNQIQQDRQREPNKNPTRIQRVLVGSSAALVGIPPSLIGILLFRVGDSVFSCWKFRFSGRISWGEFGFPYGFSCGFFCGVLAP